MKTLPVTRYSLLDRVFSGDESAWQDFCLIYAPVIRHWCACGMNMGKAGFRRLTDDTADDICQQVFTVLIRNPGAFRRQGAKFRSWLYVVTRNTAVSQYRQQERSGFPGGPPSDRIAETNHESADAERIACDDAVRDALQIEYEAVFRLLHSRHRMSQRNLDIFRRRLESDLTTQEIAAEFGVSHDAARAAISRVSRKLKQVFGPEGT